VPIDGIGHQMHITIGWPSVAETKAMLDTFVPLGLEQQITEMDVSIYTNNSESFPTPPRDRLLRQAYKYRDLFALYRRYADHISSVTIWGLADDDTWLDTFPVTRNDAPLLFDEQLQAKPAFWGVVDPSRIDATPSPSVTVSVPNSPPASASASASVSASPSASASITPTDSPLPRPCRAAYRVLGQWTGGFQGEVAITCPHGSDGWTLRWAFPDGQRISQAWNGTATQNGAEVTVTPVPYNRSIPVGGSVTVGFIGTWTGSNGAPAQVYVNGLPALPPVG
jgi:endo-1,4-beta-xylanase